MFEDEGPAQGPPQCLEGGRGGEGSSASALRLGFCWGRGGGGGGLQRNTSFSVTSVPAPVWERFQIVGDRQGERHQEAGRHREHGIQSLQT